METNTRQTHRIPEYLKRLRKLLDPQSLPAALPLCDGPESKYWMFVNFDLDPDILEKTEGEVATVSEQFKGVFGWQTRSSGDGIIHLEERGRCLLAVVDVLEHFHDKYPADAVLSKWAHDIQLGAEHAYAAHGAKLPDLTGKTALKRRRASTATTSPGTPSTTVDEQSSIAVESQASAVAQPPTRKATKGAGRPPKELMNSAITKGVASPSKKGKGAAYWACISPPCHYRAFGNASEVRVFKHAATCQHLRHSHPTVYHAIVNEQSSSSLGARLSSAAVGSAGMGMSPDSHEGVACSASVVADTSNANRPSHKKPRLANGTLSSFVERGLKEKRKADRAALQEKVDHAIMRLICVRGLVPSIVDSAEWKELMQLLNPNYQHTASEKFTKEYIPKEAAFVREQELKEIRNHRNITITFDGNSTRRDSIYFVHATTPDRSHYFIGSHIGTDEHHTVTWVKDKVMQSINSVGILRTAAVCSDSTTVTLNTRSEISKDIPTIFDLRDCCHHLQNIIADITKLPVFSEPMSHMKRIISHFSKSTFGRALLQQETDSGTRLLALQKVGKTRFGSHWSAAQSLLPAMPRIRELVQAKEIKFKHKQIQAIFAGRINYEYTRLEHALVQYTTIVEPLIRSLWALEASSANAADVFVFFTACAASLRDLFARGSETTGIEGAVAKSVTDIFNDRYDEFFFHNEIYFAAFALDPRYPVADYLLISPTAEPSITIPREGANLERRHPRAYDRMKQFVREALKDMFNCKDNHPNEPFHPVLAKLGRTQASIELKQQLESYWDGLYPFDTPIGSRSTLAYWTDLEDHRHARVLAIVCIKIFAVLVNSMPDERTGSKFTWFNSALRGSQHAQTLVDMVQIGQYYYRKDASTQTHRQKSSGPTVKFRNISQDMLEAVREQLPQLLDPESDSDSSDDDTESTRPSQRRQAIRSRPATSSGASDTQKPAEESATRSGSSGDAGHRPGTSTTELLPNTEMNLAAPSLLDLLSDKTAGGYSVLGYP